MDEHICAGCGHPIEPDAEGKRRYRSFFSTVEDHFDRVHDSDECVRLRNESMDEMNAMLGAVRGAWRESMTPPELRAACLAFHTEHRRHVDQLTAILLVTIGSWIIEGAKQGHDRHVLEQVAAAETHRCVATLMRGVKERRGEPFVPARLAIVAYFLAINVAKADPFKCDIDGAVAAFEAGLTERDADDEEAA